jgi:alanine racemase
MSRPIQALIDLPALRHNLAQLRACLAAGGGAPAHIWAVVKANAYGHGLMSLLPALQDEPSITGLALIEFDAAQALRDAGWTRPILMLEGPFQTEDIALAQALDLSLVLHSMQQVQWLQQHVVKAPALGLSNLHLKINTGMNRLGFTPAQVEAAVMALQSQIRPQPDAKAGFTLMTHFSDADSGWGVAQQRAVFDTVLASLRRRFPQLHIDRSLANSAAILAHPAQHGDAVRPGIMLYGSSPFGVPVDDDRLTNAASDLRPVMTLQSRLIAIQSLQPGAAVGYGHTYIAERAMRIGVVACGYADGYPRHAPGGNAGGTPVLVAGQRTRTVGRVSMDLLCVDLTGIASEAAEVGAPVTLWGDGLSVDVVAAAAGTIGYELLCALAPRVPVRVVGA